MTTQIPHKIQFATLVRFIKFRKDGGTWIVDIDFEDGHAWLGWYTAKTKRAALQHIKAVTGYDVQFGTDKRVGWL